MDIDYLLFLQNFRIGINDALTPFLENLSLLAISYLIFFPVLIYWMIDKKTGLYPLLSMGLTLGINSIVKLTVCAYRPWIRDERIVPAGNAIHTATGYSFPSGHTANSGPIYGGLAVKVWKSYKWLSVILVILYALTAFSRNYLGVHTPQDVLFGTLESVLALILIDRIFRYLDIHPEKENLFLLISFLFGWAALAYITFKPYPMTYVDGKLLVDPQKMMNDGYSDICCLIAFPIARFIERKWVRFKPAGFGGKGIIVSVAGLIPLALMITFMSSPLDAAFGSHWGHFLHRFIMVMYYIALYPMVIKAVCGGEKQE